MPAEQAGAEQHHGILERGSPAGMLLLSLAALMALLPHQASAETTCFGATFQTVSSNFQYKARITNTSCDLSKTK